VTCPHCAQAAGFHGFRPFQPLSLLGPLHYGRAYYYCRRCGRGLCPFDDDAGLTGRRQTPGLERAASLAGSVAGSFREAADEVLWELAGIRLSESTVQRTTEDAGARLRHAWAEGATFGQVSVWGWHRDYEGCTCAYVGSDATGVRQQGANGATAEGRMVNVGVIYNPVPEFAAPPRRPPQMQARYLAGFYSYDDLGSVMRRQGAQVGMDRAERWIALCDGANGLDDMLDRNFPRVEVVILDFYHPAEYLGDLAKALHPKDEAQAEAVAGEWCRLLKEEGGAVVMAVLQEWDWPPRQPALRAQLAQVLEYFGNHVHRMEYPEYLAKGWHIGSGPVEAACKLVVGQRLKGTGMRWGEDGADSVSHLRALFRSEPGQWEAFWNRDRNHGSRIGCDHLSHQQE
jgi:hypothetical protein